MLGNQTEPQLNHHVVLTRTLILFSINKHFLLFEISCLCLVSIYNFKREIVSHRSCATSTIPMQVSQAA